MMCRNIVGMALAAGLVLGSAAYAHHSTSLYVDVSKTISVTGTFSELKFVNPHVVVKLYAPNNGETVLWSGETHGPSSLLRLGWKANMFRKGEKITVVGNPSRDGSPYVQLTEVRFPDGYVLSPAKNNPPRPGT